MSHPCDDQIGASQEQHNLQASTKASSATMLQDTLHNKGCCLHKKLRKFKPEASPVQGCSSPGAHLLSKGNHWKLVLERTLATSRAQALELVHEARKRLPDFLSSNS